MNDSGLESPVPKWNLRYANQVDDRKPAIGLGERDLDVGDETCTTTADLDAFRSTEESVDNNAARMVANGHRCGAGTCHRIVERFSP